MTTPARENRLLLGVALAFAMALPSATTWLYFIGLAQENASPNLAQQIAFVTGKVVQFLLPLTVVFLIERRIPFPTRPRFDGMTLGVIFGLMVAAAMLCLYFAILAHSSIMADAPRRVQEKVTQLGMTSPARYWLLAVAYVVGHSLFEEYYWRWFVFGQLRKLLPFWMAATFSSLAFMAHHVLLLFVYLPGHLWLAVVPLSLCIAVGGAFWCWLYERTGTVYAAWVSHGIIDGAIFVLGWILLQRVAA
jgi:membrane protease YdiL (CAAX protease family)